jgi:hypothetical protein
MENRARIAPEGQINLHQKRGEILTAAKMAIKNTKMKSWVANLGVGILANTIEYISNFSANGMTICTPNDARNESTG